MPSNVEDRSQLHHSTHHTRISKTFYIKSRAHLHWLPLFPAYVLASSLFYLRLSQLLVEPRVNLSRDSDPDSTHTELPGSVGQSQYQIRAQIDSLTTRSIYPKLAEHEAVSAPHIFTDFSSGLASPCTLT